MMNQKKRKSQQNKNNKINKILIKKSFIVGFISTLLTVIVAKTIGLTFSTIKPMGWEEIGNNAFFFLIIFFWLVVCFIIS
ncbi:MAG: hypothetical protein KBB61_04900 [Paludibacteraceae bacterium]|jgi:uncharacterized membrane protein|nr:hypothetical protein [Paludibacteraceae bacterium]HOG37096.1 hypothetical protein [Paludibacteraceae bacterium]HOS38077.1 hypothetical protein [Paludibacteraceae bacterium]HPK20419.1 hypothetical protein [Paludibacteraceae bacterium]